VKVQLRYDLTNVTQQRGGAEKMKLFKVDDLARQFVDAFNEINDSDKSDEIKRSLLAGTARAYSFLFDIALNGVPVVGDSTEKKEAKQ
jgi:hypothetical protein